MKSFISIVLKKNNGGNGKSGNGLSGLRETTCSCQNHELEYIEMIPMATAYRLVVLSTLNTVLYLYSFKKTMGATTKAVMAGERLIPDALA